MKNDNGKNNIYRLDATQIVCLVICIGLGSYIPINGIGQEMARDIWISLVISFLMGLVFISLLSGILKLCPDQNLVAIHKQAFGKIAGTIVNIVYLLILILVLAYFAHIIISFWCSYYNNMKSYFTILAIALFLCIWGANFGIEAIARVSVIVTFFIFVIMLFDTVLLLPETSLDRFSPLWVFSWPMAIKTAWKIFTYQFFFLPLIFTFMNTASKKKKQVKYLALGSLLFISYYLIIFIRNVALLGDAIFLQQFIGMQALKMIEWKNPTLRLEDFGLLTMMMKGMMFLILSFYGVNLIFAETFKAKDFKKLLLPTGAILFTALIILFKITSVSSYFTLSMIFQYMVIFSVSLETTALIFLFVKKKKNKKQA